MDGWIRPLLLHVIICYYILLTTDSLKHDNVYHVEWMFGALNLTDKVIESDKHDTLHLLNLDRRPIKLNGGVIAPGNCLVYTHSLRQDHVYPTHLDTAL